MALWVVGTLSLVLVVLSLLLVGRLKKPPMSDQRKIYDQLCKKLATIGFAPTPGETPQQFFRRVVAARADLASSLIHIARLFELMAYGDDPAARVQLLAAAAKFQAKK